MPQDHDNYWQAVQNVAELSTSVELCDPCFKGANSTRTAIGWEPLMNVARHRR